MDNDIKTCLYDILQSINEIDGYYENKARISNLITLRNLSVPVIG